MAGAKSSILPQRSGPFKAPRFVLIFSDRRQAFAQSGRFARACAMACAMPTNANSGPAQLAQRLGTMGHSRARGMVEPAMMKFDESDRRQDRQKGAPEKPVLFQGYEFPRHRRPKIGDLPARNVKFCQVLKRAGRAPIRGSPAPVRAPRPIAARWIGHHGICIGHWRKDW